MPQVKPRPVPQADSMQPRIDTDEHRLNQESEARMYPQMDAVERRYGSEPGRHRRLSACIGGWNPDSLCAFVSWWLAPILVPV